MRGKKVDKEFISNYISECVSKDIQDLPLILEFCNQEIDNVSKKIIEAEKLKIYRSKLLDVKTFLEKK